MPLSSHLAANHFNQQQAEQEERMRMKKLTLDINERQEQEDYQGERRKRGQFVSGSLGVCAALVYPPPPPFTFAYRDDAVAGSETRPC